MCAPSVLVVAVQLTEGSQLQIRHYYGGGGCSIAAGAAHLRLHITIVVSVLMMQISQLYMSCVLSYNIYIMEAYILGFICRREVREEPSSTGVICAHRGQTRPPECTLPHSSARSGTQQAAALPICLTRAQIFLDTPEYSGGVGLEDGHQTS